MTGAVRHDARLHRYELVETDGAVFMHYHRDGDRIVILHTETPPELQGRGLAGKLFDGIIADVRAQGLKIVPRCSYATVYFERHPEARDVLAP